MRVRNGDPQPHTSVRQRRHLEATNLYMASTGEGVAIVAVVQRVDPFEHVATALSSAAD